MKKREEMIRDVHRRIEEYEAEKKAERARLTRTAAAAVPLCAAFALGLGLWKSGVFESSGNRSAVSDSGAVIYENATVTSAYTAVATHKAQATAPAGIADDNVTTKSSVSSAKTSTVTLAAAAAELTEPTVNTTAAVTESNHTEVQTTAAVQQTTSSAARPSSDMLGTALIGGEYYLQTFPSGVEYTPDRYIGCGSDFEGYYADCGMSAEFYTVRENADIVLVKFSSGGQVYLKRTDLGEEQFRKDQEQIKEMERNGAVF